MLFVAQFIFSSMLIIYSSIADYYICLCVPILVSMASLLTSYNHKFMHNIPFNGAGGDWLLTPS
jgi:hypothetical protein